MKKFPISERSAAFQTDTDPPPLFVTSTRSPSKAACSGALIPFPVRVARTTPLEARTTETEEDSRFGTQMLAPSKAGKKDCEPKVTVWIA